MGKTRKSFEERFKKQPWTMRCAIIGVLIGCISGIYHAGEVSITHMWVHGIAYGIVGLIIGLFVGARASVGSENE